MNLPRDEAFDKLVAAIRGLRGNAFFEEVVKWVRSERDMRDVENRRIGLSNQTSEAQALSVIIDLLEKVASGTFNNRVAGSVPHDPQAAEVSPGYEGAG